MSRKAANKGRAILEGVGLEAEDIEACFSSHPLNEEEAVQAGLIKWSAGQSHKPPSWESESEVVGFSLDSLGFCVVVACFFCVSFVVALR